MRSIAVLLLSLSVLAAQAKPAPAPTPAPLPIGTSHRTLDLDGLPLEVFFYMPKDWNGERMLFVFHGVLRNADEYCNDAVGMGDRFGMLVVAPKFDAERFPGRCYQRGGILRADGSAAPPQEWTYARVPQIASAVRALTDKPQLKHWLIGHSAGGQFALRMSAFQETGAERIVAANPGSVLMPDLDAPFGYGFGKLPKELVDEARLKQYLAAPLTLYLGTADDKPDEYFDASEEAMVAGNGRHQRSLALYWTARTLAKERGWPFGWRLVEAEGVGHDHAAMFAHEQCETALFGDKQAKQPVPRPEPARR
jgi:pimeloyl-ACP methyl ester carboxylesterase